MPGRARFTFAREARRALGRAPAVTATVALSCLALAVPAAAETDGKVKFVRNATSSFDPILTGSTTAQRQWMASHYWRMRGYPPFFNQALGWAPSSDFYKDLYAIYRDRTADQQLLMDHPDWVLRDPAGNMLYIPWACSNGSCTQYAADVGSPGWRQHWIDQARIRLDQGYEGIFIDDVNLNMKVGNGSGAFVRPRDPRTGAPMTDADWRRYMAEFTEQIKAQLPSAVIAHNTGQWWASHTDSYIQREVDAADVIELERGFNDAGIVGGSGTFGYLTYLAHMDWLHSRGASIMFEPYNLDATSREFELASYYLVKDLGDAIVSDYQADPGNWWTGWETDLGAPSGSRYTWNGLLRRDFAAGVVLTNQPGASTTTVTLPGGATWTDMAGNQVTSVTLGARHGKVLLKSPSPPPDTTPPETTITSGPSGTIDQASASFAFASSEPGSTFDCRLDGAAFGACSSPKAYSGLAEGPHSFEVRARDGAGNTDQSPAARSFTVALPPLTLKPNRRRVRRHSWLKLSGAAAGTDAVTLQMKVAGSSAKGAATWRSVATAGTVAEGTYRIRLRMKRRGVFRYRASAAGMTRSRIVRVRVRS